MMKLVENAVVAGKFRLNRMLGGGGMGSVWHATHLGLDIPCAVKFVKGELLEQDDIKARFEREAKAAAQLRSPHVVQILDHGVCEGTPYIAMELLDGEDLGTRLERVGRLPVEELCKIVGEACRALAKAHAQGIVHRDLKPDNIYIVRDDDREITKVLDFGIAKTLGNEVGGSSTKTGAMLGTPYYMSPEQAQGTKMVDGRSDLWALAVIVFQSVTGRLPFESEALGDLLVKIIIAPIPFPSQYAPVPAGFDKWWAKASARDPSERFQSAKDFADALALACGISRGSGVVDPSPLRAAKGGDGSEEALFVRAQYDRTLGAPPQGAAVAAVTGSAVTPPPLARSYVENAAPAPSRKTGIVLALVLGGALFVSVVSGAGWLLLGRGHSAPGPAPAAQSASGTLSGAPVPSATPPPVAVVETTSPLPSPPPSASSELASPTNPPAAGSTAGGTTGSSSRTNSKGGIAPPSRSPAGNPPPATPKPAKGSRQVDMGF
jgi:serine/threonine-protein kinase